MRPVEVIAYAGYRGEQEPRAVVLESRRMTVDRIERRWREAEADMFEVRLADGRRLELRLDRAGEWWGGEPGLA
jgi:hypothetical protein